MSKKTKAEIYFASLPSFELMDQHGLIHDEEWDDEHYVIKLNDKYQHLEQRTHVCDSDHKTYWYLNGVYINYDTFRTIKYFCRVK